MKFRSRVDHTFKFIFAALCLLFAALIGGNFLFIDFSINYVIVLDSIFGLLWLVIIWIFLDTSYKITNKKISYRTGPFFGHILLNSIEKVSVNKTSWNGVKIGLAKKGIVIKYKKDKEIYFSPKSNTTFIKDLKQKIPSLKIENYENYILK